MDKDKQEWMRLATIGPHFLVASAIGFFIGKKVDSWTGWYPVATLFFSFCGVAAGFLNLWKELQLVNREEDGDESQQ